MCNSGVVIMPPMVYLLWFFSMCLGLLAAIGWFLWSRYNERGHLPRWLIHTLVITGGLWFICWGFVLVATIVFFRSTDTDPIPAQPTTTTIHAR